MIKLTESKLIRLIREASGDTYYLHEIEDIITLLKQEVLEQILQGNSVELLGVGVFKPLKVKSREWKSPKTGEVIKAGGYVKPTFAVSPFLIKKFKKETQTDV